MKKLILGAGAFLLSSSAFANVVHANTATPDMTDQAIHASASAWAMNPMLHDAVVDAGLSQVQMANWAGDQGPQPGLMAGGKNMQPTAAHIAEKQAWLAQHAGGSTEMAMSGQAGGKTADMAGAMNGQGGPDEAAEAGDGVWPACRPGPGDDRCIQLYERGVRSAYAQWSAGRTQLAMGGPEDPVAGKDMMTHDAAMTSDMSAAAKVDTNMGPTTEPTGVRAEGKTATSMSVAQQSTDTAETHNGKTADAMQTAAASGAKANGS